ncbi:MAG TPA: hypothetical protein VFZ61_34515, partial [Polyangiales bacterium]
MLVSAGALLLWRLLILVLAAALTPAATVDIILDDAYYYLQVAYNIAHLGRSTYDGIEDTNGYQPAWMLLIAGLELLLRLEKKGLYVALQVLMLLCMALPLGFCLRRLRDPFYLGLSAGLVCSYSWFPGTYLCGLETVLFAPAFVVVAHVARRGLHDNAGRLAWILAAATWIRLDAVSLVVAFSLPLAQRALRERGPAAAMSAMARFIAPAVLVLAVYAVPNWVVFGSPVPLSGVAKTIGAPPFSNWGILYNYLLQTLPVMPFAGVVLALEWRHGRFRDGSFAYGGIALLGLSLGVHYFYYAAFSGWIPWPWYFYAYALMVALLVTRLIELHAGWSAPSQARPRAVSLAFLVLAGLAFPGLTHALVGNQAWKNHTGVTQNGGSFNRRNALDAERFARDPAPHVVAIGDRAAGLGFWSPPRVNVFAMEGLVSSRAYLDARRHDEGERYIREQIRPELLVVDRETLPLVRLANEERYVVIEPIQPRVVLDHLLVYCFRKDAVVREIHERDDQLIVLPAPATRITFDFAKAEPCTGAFADYAQAQILSPESLRRHGVGVEYVGYMGGDFNAALERF